MNRSIRRVALVAAVMFFALLANASYLAVFRADDLTADARNRRARDAEFAVERGAILVGNTPVAVTKPARGRFTYQRSYPQGVLYAPVTGYHSFDYGRSGLESSHNTELSGTDDSQFLSRLVDTFTGAKPAGASLQTTIDARAQKAASQALGDRTGAVVAINYRTGAVLALVSNPSYDPNLLASTDLTAEQANWKRLTADPTRPMSNRATREVYPPGSTFKLVTAAAALESGMKPDTMVKSPDALTLPTTSTRLTNDSDCGGATSTIDHALQVSCNTAFANLGLTLGADRLRAQAQKFGFDARLESDLDPVTSRFPANPDRPQLAMSAIGQYDVRSTPLQMAVVAAAIANDGQVMQPYLVQQVRNPDLSVLHTQEPRRLQQAVSPATAQALQTMMQHVVSEGTGRRAQVEGTVIGGKTGTAQSDKVRAPYAWFTGYAKDPQVAVCVFVEDAKVDGSEVTGGRIAGPVFASVVEALK